MAQRGFICANKCAIWWGRLTAGEADTGEADTGEADSEEAETGAADTEEAVDISGRWHMRNFCTISILLWI